MGGMAGVRCGWRGLLRAETSWCYGRWRTTQRLTGGGDDGAPEEMEAGSAGTGRLENSLETSDAVPVF